MWWKRRMISGLTGAETSSLPSRATRRSAGGCAQISAAVLGSGGTRLVVLCVALAALVGAAPTATAAERRPPNIVYVLADDLSWDLLAHMPQVQKMQRQGMTFDQFAVADSLCCSSRATILTGQFPHNTKVLSNSRPNGGYGRFRDSGARMRSVGIAMQAAGYRTA